jgi:CRISPR/Cas system CSM-associated protein Csm3 (group 7 of RAMP superfamily)
MPLSECVYYLRFRTPVSVFTGLGIAGLLDRTVVRAAKWRPSPSQAGEKGLPYIPGSTVKGRLRFFADRMLRSAPPSGGCWLHPDKGVICKNLDRACTSCKLFGNPAIPALLQVSDALLDPTWQALIRTSLAGNHNPVVCPDVEIRPGIALSRKRRTALGDHLFFDEVVPPLTFSGKLLLDARVSRKERDFLIQAATLVDGLGARKCAGRGRLEGGIHIAEAGI